MDAVAALLGLADKLAKGEPVGSAVGEIYISFWLRKLRVVSPYVVVSVATEVDSESPHIGGVFSETANHEKKRTSASSITFLVSFVALVDMHHSSVLGFFSARSHHKASFEKKYYEPNYSSSASWTSSCSQHCRRTTFFALEENSDDGGSRNNITPLCDLQTFLRLVHIAHICLSHSCFVST